MNLRLDLAYDGEPFRGFARQVGVRTVQGEIEDALGKLLQRDVFTVGAGRTDAGVHAMGQVMSTGDAPSGIDTIKLRDGLNAMLAPSIAFSSVAEAPPDFHARFSARSRTYVYAVNQSEIPDPFLARTCLQHGHRLDLDAMNEAAGHLLGSHDFSSFGRVSDDGSAQRTLLQLVCKREGDIIRIRARANAFIQQMVRSLVGTLLQVGQGKRSPDEIPSILAARDRSAAGPVSPPHGLCLVAVEYDPVPAP